MAETICDTVSRRLDGTSERFQQRVTKIIWISPIEEAVRDEKGRKLLRRSPLAAAPAIWGRQDVSPASADDINGRQQTCRVDVKDEP